MSLRPSTRRRPPPTSPVGRWSLNNAGKTVNLFREYAARQSTHIRWMAGHGLQVPEPGRVPSDTFVVFMGTPGQFAATSLLPPDSKAYRSIQYLRDVFAGRVANILPTRLGYWKRHVYGPGDTFPDLKIDMWDYWVESLNIPRSNNEPTAPTQIRHDWPRSPYDKISGVKDMNTGVKILYKKTRTISQVLRARGPGIYLIMACRASSQRVSSGNALRNALAAPHTGMTAQQRMRRIRAGVTTNAVNLHVQTHENNQGRIATRKRGRNNGPTLRRTSPSTRRSTPPALRGARKNAQGNTIMNNA